MQQTKNPKGKPGSIIKIPLGDETVCWSYALMLKNFYWMFFDYKDCGRNELILNDLLHRDIIFQVKW